MSIHLVIHGHFYQPPRENPWTGAIERQESAAPFHDWNARIAEECYLANVAARVLDERGRIQSIVNNYEGLSFNFGPTLLSWLAGAAPGFLEQLAAADRASRERLGHGNAIAQVYNHLIMPLAAPRDRWTQIQWGLRDFRHRFHRHPEAMWLSETAVDAATLSLLVDAGMRHLILSPAQAARWRPLGAAHWTGPEQGEIDPRRPYRWIERDAAGRPRGDRGLDICFYHAPLSRGISFQHYLRDAGLLAARVAEAAAGMPDPLILIASDGESFGHHEKFGEMCLATLFTREASRQGFSVTNLGAYLERHRPAWEVELLPASAWSCAHGVGRWFEDCGCSAGGGAGWTQAWRGPLRQGLDRLRDAMAGVFQDEGARLLRDPWVARDDYIDLLLDPTDAARDAFFARHQLRPLDAEGRGRAMRLLEMQHQALLMYTSCAWFFSDISGIETVQNLRYAARAIELAAPFAPVDLEAVLLEDLGRARSNVETYRTGREIWARQVRPSRVRPEDAATRLLAEALLGRPLAPQTRYRWALAPDPVLREPDFVAAGVHAVSEITGEALRLAAAIRRDGPYGFLAGVAPWSADTWAAFVEEARSVLIPRDSRLAAWSGRHAATLVRPADLLRDERHALLRDILSAQDASHRAAVERWCQELLPTAEALADAGMPLPAWLKGLLETSWTWRFAELLAELRGAVDPVAYAGLLDLADRARLLGITLDLSAAATVFGRTLIDRLDAIAGQFDADAWRDFLELLHVASRLGIGVPERALQDRMFALLQHRLPAWVAECRDAQGPAYRAVSAVLAVANRLNVRTDEARAPLAPLEEPVASDPTYWP